MTSPSTQESARQVLGRALRFFREQRKMSQRNLADRVGCSVGDIDDWERGKHAPPDNRWGRLCKMLHDDLSGMRVTWQRARAEEEREKTVNEARPVGHLTSKPFANIGQVLAKSPKLTVVPPPRPESPVPEALHDDGFDLRPAYRAITKLPEGWRTTEAVEARQAYARELILGGLSNDDIYKQVRLKYSVGIEAKKLTKLRADIREERTREYHRTQEPVEVAPPFVLEVKMLEPPKPLAPSPTENNIEGAVRLILEAIPNLKSFKVEVSDNGEIDVSHTIREVKVVETSSSMKLRKP